MKTFQQWVENMFGTNMVASFLQPVGAIIMRKTLLGGVEEKPKKRKKKKKKRS